MKTYEIDNTLDFLKRKGYEIKGCNIDISYPYMQGKIGNKTWGMLDFLVKHKFTVSGFYDNCNYFPIFNGR